MSSLVLAGAKRDTPSVYDEPERPPDPLADIPLIAAPEWAADAACVAYSDLEIWTASPAPDPDEIAVAARICRRCPVVAECAEYARQHPAYGIWGGEWISEKRGMRDRRSAAA